MESGRSRMASGRSLNGVVGGEDLVCWLVG
jgi:hypothetical protein